MSEAIYKKLVVAQHGEPLTENWLEQLVENIDYLKNNIDTARTGIAPGIKAEYFGESAPDGWLFCDGRSLLRSEFPGLYAAIGIMYGEGDNPGNTFNIPDMRGHFTRCIDLESGIDPDADSRSDRGDGTVGNAVGTKQNDALQGHTHDFYYIDYRLGSGGAGMYMNSSSANTRATRGKHIKQPVEYGDYGAPKSSKETRPINIYTMYIIKY